MYTLYSGSCNHVFQCVYLIVDLLRITASKSSTALKLPRGGEEGRG